MSHKYWKRVVLDNLTLEPKETIYFATQGAEAHKAAEEDPDATRVTPEEYAANVPKEVHEGADGQAQGEAGDEHAKAANDAWGDLQRWAAQHPGLTPQEQIAMLTLLQHRICEFVWSQYGAKEKV